MLPFSGRTAQRYMAIAQDKRLSNPTRVSDLPSSWYTLYELSKLDDETKRLANPTHGSDLPTSYRTLYELSKLDDETFEQALAQGKIKELGTAPNFGGSYRGGNGEERRLPNPAAQRDSNIYPLQRST